MTNVVSQNTILSTLGKGGFIQYDNVNAKPVLLDKAFNAIGTIRFDTFLKLCGYAWINRCKAPKGAPDWAKDYFRQDRA